MNNFDVLKFWRWIFNRSPQNAANPNVQMQSMENMINKYIPPGCQLIETYIDIDSNIDSGLDFGIFVNIYRGEDGNLVRVKRKISRDIGCEHTISQSQAEDKDNQHIPGRSGSCYYCLLKWQKEAQAGHITFKDAKRLSSVCTDCAHITASGHLCCPKHWKEINNPEGSPIYLGPEDIESQKRQQTLHTVLDTLATLFSRPITDNKKSE